jgi:uncharacterized protein
MRDFPPISTELMAILLAQYRLPWFGTHGIGHWGRVYENGARLAKATGADPYVVAYFAVFHDACRANESIDPGHGLRGAQLAEQLREDWLPLDETQFELLYRACAGHTDGLTEAPISVQACWDADRLDLGRVGIPPVPEQLCTEAARDPAVLRWANSRSRYQKVPAFVFHHWLGDKEKGASETR